MGFLNVLVVPSPKSQSHEDGVGVEVSVKLTASGAEPDVGDPVKSALSENVAVTFLAWVITTVHVPVPEQPSPDHPMNMEPCMAFAVKMTEVLEG